MYKIHLTEPEIRALRWARSRYLFGELVDCLDVPQPDAEHPRVIARCPIILPEDAAPCTFTLSEADTWAWRDRVDEDAENGSGVWTCMGRELAEKLQELYDSIV